jgi:hypothetical protein
MTMYEKESLFESLDKTHADIKAYVEGAIGREELHDDELNLFRRVLRLGRGLLACLVPAIPNYWVYPRSHL